MTTIKKKILLIEDNAGDSRLLKELLNDARPGKYEITSAATLYEGLELLAKDKFDIVLGRAITALPQFLEWASPLLSLPQMKEAGVYYWKGGPLENEIDKLRPTIHPLPDLLFNDPAFEDKYIVYIAEKRIK